MDLHTPIPGAKAGVDFVKATGHLKYHVGCDLGSLRDHTAIAIVRDILKPAPRWGKGYKQLFEPRRLELCGLVRLKIGIDWGEIVDFLKRLQQTPEISGATFTVDTTGLGAVAGSMLRERGVSFTGVTITGGDNFSEVSAQQYRVAKMFLLTNLSTLLQGELKIAANMSDVKELRSQIDNFAVSYSAAGNMQVNAAKGHDDLLLAAALAAFSATHVKRNFFMSTPISW